MEELQNDPRCSSQDEEKTPTENAVDVSSDGDASPKGQDILALQDLDPALNMKMHLVNDVGSHLSLYAYRCISDEMATGNR